ncbi:hypothetical protein ABTL25_20230, partial [Acinetobacter baumannii]
MAPNEDFIVPDAARDAVSLLEQFIDEFGGDLAVERPHGPPLRDPAEPRRELFVRRSSARKEFAMT